MIYVGDGRGDFYSSLKLGEGDHIDHGKKRFSFMEEGFVTTVCLKANYVHEWSNGEELERILIQLLDTDSI
ncbi:hypothetical protein RHGRI_013052 [Rhododendron griersonianum]|uniref:Uncharacterized protein n=1 Tax=Rhododendron griersonianum TaxID=479676 RepID=A0AAV6K4E8_9ERIC|nr:hypothetical protein RHGRI_013052 [Rhododendron griersonianum]